MDPQTVKLSTISTGIANLAEQAKTPQERKLLHNVTVEIGNEIRQQYPTFDTKVFLEQCNIPVEWKQAA